MANDLSLATGLLFFVAGTLYLLNHGIVLLRFRKIHLSLSILRGINFLLYSFLYWAFSLGIFATNLEQAFGWYQFVIFSLLMTEMLNIVYMNYVHYGRFRGINGATMMFLAGINLAMLWFPENLGITYFPDLGAFYPVPSPAFFFTNLIFGIFHTLANATANVRVVRRPDVLWRSKLKFIFFTSGIVLVHTAFAVTVLYVMIFHDASGFIWIAIASVLGFGFTFAGLFYANTSVFSLPIRLYLLVIFGVRGEILYEKWFSKRESETALLLPKAAASIASLVDNVFSQSQRMHLLSLKNRMILYEWKKGMGIMLVADQDSSVFRNSMRQLLQRLEYQQNKKQELDALVQEIFNYYPLEYDNTSPNKKGVK